MAAVTVSSLSHHSFVVQENVLPAPRTGAAPGHVPGGAPKRADKVLAVRPRDAAPRRDACAPRPADAGMRRLDRMEYEARGLLNLVTLLSRCLQDGAVSAAERRGWRAEVWEANERLEALYLAGLSRTFLTDPPPKSAGGAVATIAVAAAPVRTGPAEAAAA